MNYLSLAMVMASLMSSAQGLITFSQPTYGSIWYTNFPNNLSLVSDNASEAFANVRISGCRDCFEIPVYTNQTIPVYVPRNLRESSGLNIYAVSNLENTATSGVILVNPFATSNCCRRSCRERCCPCSEEGSASGAADAPLEAVDPSSTAGLLALASQEAASIEMFEDIQLQSDSLATFAAAQELPQELAAPEAQH